MRSTIKVFSIGFQVILRDAIMLVLIPAPFLVGVTFHYLLPLLNRFLIQHFTFTIERYYALSDGLMMLLAPILLTMSSAFLLLEESDEGISSYFQITPAGRHHYLMARIGIPALWGFFCSIVIGKVFYLSILSLSVIVAFSFVAALFACAIAMLIVAFANNRVEGLALSKLTGITMIGIFVPWFVSDSWRWIAGILPTFWLGELIRGASLGTNLFLGTITSLVWIACFTKRFLQKINH
ncbi:hypothetical protein [Candidatus Enterococcus murrayae]|uniref:Uncharacterized protein n=1 Tax=Candidatus Enterococcus murrayae TaxID=2815321 RepID=A0ABS3HI28_9ENTE|nr:hypothetical protein [Enterococcus sp. MJM16]MBO0452238.1 hypothetical protein [Enterococcus sp. MJM16]